MSGDAAEALERFACIEWVLNVALRDAKDGETNCYSFFGRFDTKRKGNELCIVLNLS